MYGLRQQIVVVPTRFFKWDSPREWALKFQTHFSAKLGFGFEDAPAVSSMFQWQVATVANDISSKIK